MSSQYTSRHRISFAISADNDDVWVRDTETFSLSNDEVNRKFDIKKTFWNLNFALESSSVKIINLWHLILVEISRS